jgi:ribosomal protein S18 acetylase RimI-like enzyme
MKISAIEISEVKHVDASLEASFAQLIPQLTHSNPPPNEALLKQIVASDATRILVARDQAAYGRIIATLTLAIYTSPTASKAWIEDVIVDHTYRRKGIGEALILEAIKMAKKSHANVVLLSSNVTRVEATKLYQKLGFCLRETNYYQLKL